MATQETFILRVDFFPQIKMLSREQRGDLMTAIFAYSAGEEMPDMDQVTTMCFGFIRSSLDANAERYQARCAKNRENGGRGGRPAEKTERLSEKPNGFKNNRMVSDKTERLSEKPNGFLQNPIDTDLDSDTESDLDNDSLSLRSREASASAEPTAEEREKFFRIFFLKNFRNPAAEVERFIAHYKATGWVRRGAKIVDRAALAQAWAEQTTTAPAPPPFPAPFMACWAEIYEALRPRADCGPLFHDLRAVQLTPERKIILTTGGGKLYDLLEQQAPLVRPILDKHYPMHTLHYRVPRGARK